MFPANVSSTYHKSPRGPKANTPYRRVFTRIWASASFRHLSAPREANAQFLFLFLLTNIRASSIPGLVDCSPASIAGQLGWSVEGVRSCLDELVDAGMAEYDEAGLVWLTNAIDHEPPANPSVVASWWKIWNTLPECPLKVRVWDVLHAFLSERGPTWLAPFNECRRPVLTPASSRRPRVTSPASQPDSASGHGVGHGVRHQTAGSSQQENFSPPSRVHACEAPAPVAVLPVVVPLAPPTEPCPSSVPEATEPRVEVPSKPPVAESPKPNWQHTESLPPQGSPPVVAAPTAQRTLSPEADAILTEMERYPSLASIATAQRAEGASTLLVTLGVTLADVLAGLRDLAAKAAMVSWSADQLAQSVPSYARIAAKRRREGGSDARPAVAARVTTPAPVRPERKFVSPAWAERFRAKPHEGPVDVAAARAELASTRAAIAQRKGTTREEWLAQQKAALHAADMSAAGGAL